MAMEVNAKSGVKRAQIEATVIRADGRIEHLGTISSSSLLWRLGARGWLARRRIRKANATVQKI